MSYDIYAVDKNGETIIVENHDIKGGTYAVGGTNQAHLNITCNYYKFFQKYINEKEGIVFLGGIKVIDSIKILNEAISKMKYDGEFIGYDGNCQPIIINDTDDYWKSTEGNAKKALVDLRELALLVLKVDTEAIWEVSY